MKWATLQVGESTWEPTEDFKAAFPDFQLKDQLLVDGGG